MLDGKQYRRVTEVIDCWFDSGAMPYAQWHYPFQNTTGFERRFPADFICEAIDQTRGWFYTLHAIATMVSDKAAYRNVVCLSHIVDEDGKKMSKSLGNIIDPYAVFDTTGADALRWHFAARVAPDMQKRVSVDIVADVAKSFINTYWNTYAFFVMYARLDQIDVSQKVADTDRPETDRWIISLLEQTVLTATEALDSYDALRAGSAIERFVDQLSNWYVRRNRRRFWKAVGGQDKQSAYNTLYECLEVVNRLMAPFMPFLSEHIHHNLVSGLTTEAPESVHMTEWPTHHPDRLDQTLLSEMEVVQRVVALGRAARNDANLKVRQPLARLLARVPDESASRAIVRHAEQIRDELNVKSVTVIPRDAELVKYRIKPNLPVVGKRYGRLLPAIQRALAAAPGADIAATVARGGYLVGLDTRLDHDLVLEGIARELVRTVQDARKQAGLNVSDRIWLHIEGNEPVMAALAAHRDYVMAETLASHWMQLPHSQGFCIEHSLGSAHWIVRLDRDGSSAQERGTGP
jgi:isoleucyl-tRNA synthetase